MRALSTTLVLIAALVTANTAQAQDDPEGEAAAPPTEAAAAEEPAAEEPPAAEQTDEEFLSGEEQEKELTEEEKEADDDEAFLTDTEKAEIEAPEEEKDIGREEDPDTPYFSVGARFRWIMIPEWFINMFGVDSTRNPKHDSPLPLISNVGVGPEFIYRKGGFDITAAVWWSGLGWDKPISFKGKGEDGNSWEVVENSMSAVLITVDFIWSTSFADWFAITYGAGLGVGIPIGDIIRTEATEASEGTEKCLGPQDQDAWCQTEEDEYGKVYDLPTGIVPWINFLLGARFKPHRHVAIYIDGGFGLGFQVGARAGYIF